MKPTRHAIVCFLNDRYFDYFRACYHSLSLNYPGHPRLLVAYEGRSAVVESFLDRADITRIAPHCPPRHVAVDPNRLIDPIVFNRFCLWSDEFDDYDNLLHLDVDTLVLGNLDDILARRDFFIVANHEPSSCARIFAEEARDDAELRARLREDGIEFPDGMDDMANAGVFVIPRRYRCRDERERLEYLLERYGAYVAYADQSVISLWCLVRNIPYSCDYRLNCQAPMLGDGIPGLRLGDVRLLHFSNYKPDTDAFMSWNRIDGLQETLRGLYETYLHHEDGRYAAARP